jgi:hypothetical protein
LKVELLQKINLEEYENFINKNNFSTFYHTKNHLLFLKDLLNLEPYFFQVTEHDEILGVMPFFMKKSKFGSVINSLPFFGSYGGLVATKNCEKLILDKLNEFNLENDVLSSVITPNPFLNDESIYEKYYTYSFKDPRLIQCTNIFNSNENILWGTFEQRVRRAIRKSEKLNIQVSKTELTDDVIEEFYKMHKIEIQSKGGKIKPSNFFENLKNHFKINHDYEVFCAQKDGKNLSYLLIFYHNNYAEYYMPAYDSNSKNTQSTSLLIWNSMKSSLNHGANFYNFGGTWKNQPELYRFKRGWGAIDYNYNYYINCDLEKIKEIGIDELLKNFEFFYIIPYNRL